MHQRTHFFFFWVILLLVGLNFVISDPGEETPVPSQGSPVALIDSDDVDDPDHSLAFTLISHAQLSLLPLDIFFLRLAPSGRIEPPTQSTTPQLLLLSLRSPRSPTAN